MTQESHLNRIRIEGYKSIKKLELDMEPINILIGANGAGKSNFISVFTMLRAVSQGKFKDFIENNGSASSFLHFGAKNTSQIVIDIDMPNNGYHAELVHDPFEDQLDFKREYCTFTLSEKAFYLRGKNGESGLYEGEADSTRVRNYTKEYLEKCRVYHFHDTGRTAGFKQSSKIDSTSYLYTDASNIAAFLYQLKKNDEKSYFEIVEAVRSIAPFFHDFYLEPKGEGEGRSILLKWLHKEHEDPFSAQQLSDGTARFICMATLFLQPRHLRPDTIILDEPELGLHPAALEILADIIKATSKEGQVICSTQSVTFSNHFSVNDFIVVDQNKGVSEFKRPETDDLKMWLEDYEMGDIWNKNLIGGRPEW